MFRVLKLDHALNEQIFDATIVEVLLPLSFIDVVVFEVHAHSRSALA